MGGTSSRTSTKCRLSSKKVRPANIPADIQRSSNRVDSPHIKNTQDLLWELGNPMENQLTTLETLMVHDNHRIPFQQVASLMGMLAKIFYSDLRFTGVIDCAVLVTMVHQDNQYTIAGHGNVELPVLKANEAICPCNSKPGNIMMVRDVQQSNHSVAAQGGIHVYLGGRFHVLPTISICYLAFQPIKQPRVLDAMEQYMHDMFPKLDTMMDDFVSNAVKTSYLESIVEDSPGVAFVEYTNVTNDKIDFKYVSPTSEMFGFHSDDLLADPMTFLRIIHHEDVEKFIQHKTQCIATLKQQEVHFRVIVNGKFKHLYGQCNTKKIDDNHYQFTGMVLDVTHHRKLQDELEAKSMILKQVPGMAYVFAMDDKQNMTCPYASEGCVRISNMDPSVIIDDAMTLVNLIHPEDRESFMKTVIVSKETLSNWDWKGRFVLHDGTTKHVHCQSTPKKKDDNTVEWYGLMLDITDMQNEKDQLHDRFKAVNDTVNDGLVEFDPHGNIKFMTNTIKDICGINQSQNIISLLPTDIDLRTNQADGSKVTSKQVITYKRDAITANWTHERLVDYYTQLRTVAFLNTFVDFFVFDTNAILFASKSVVNPSHLDELHSMSLTVDVGDLIIHHTNQFSCCKFEITPTMWVSFQFLPNNLAIIQHPIEQCLDFFCKNTTNTLTYSLDKLKQYNVSSSALDYVKLSYNCLAFNDNIMMAVQDITELEHVTKQVTNNDDIIQNTRVATLIVQHDFLLTVVQMNPSAKNYFGNTMYLTQIVDNVPFYKELFNQSMDKLQNKKQNQYNHWFYVKCTTQNDVTIDCILMAVPHGPNTTAILIEDISDYVKRKKEQATYAAEKAKDLEHNKQMSHHHKNSYISLTTLLEPLSQYVQKSSPMDIQLNVKSMMEIAQHGTELCLRSNALKLIQYGVYTAAQQWTKLRTLLGHWSNKVINNIDAELMVQTDEILLKIILQNYISNALRYGSGTCSVSVSISNRVIISVVNTPHPDHLDKHQQKVEQYKHPHACFQFESMDQHKYREGIGLRGVQQCCDALEADYGVVFKPTHVEAYVSIANITRTQHKTHFDNYPVVACLDDSKINRKMMSKLLNKTHCSTASFVQGVTMNELKQFVQKVLNHHEPVDICIIDQNLDDPERIQVAMQGTDVVKSLKQQGYKGRCFIRSANDGPVDLALYHDCGAGFISKTVNDPATFIQTIESIHDNITMDNIVVECDLDDIREMYHDIYAKYKSSIEQYHERNFDVFWKTIHQLKGDVMAIGLKKLGLTCEAFRHLGNNYEAYHAPFATFQQEFTIIFEDWRRKLGM